MYLLYIVFWDTRIAASHLTTSQTRLPDIPDQTGFLHTWYDWHRGYTMTENADGVQERQMLQSGCLGDVAPGQLPQPEHSEETLVVETEDDSMDHPAVTQAPDNSHSMEEPIVDPEDRLFDSPPRSPRLLTTRSMSSDERRFITEEESMPPNLREIQPFLNSQRPLVASPEEIVTDQTLRHLRLVVANTSQAEAEAIIAEQAARLQLHLAHTELERTRENLNNTRRVSQNSQRRIREYETANRVFGAREQIESQGSGYMSPITAMIPNVERWSAEQREAAVTLPERTAGAAGRSHSHPSRRDESRTDQSSPSSGFVSRAGSVRLAGSRVAEGRPVPGAPNSPVRGHSLTRALNHVRPGAQENSHPSNDGRHDARRPRVDSVASTGNTRVLTNVTNIAPYSAGRASSPHPSNDILTPPYQRLDIARPRITEVQRVTNHPRRPTETESQGWTRNRAESFAASFGPYASPSQPLISNEHNRRLEELNGWYPQSTDLGPHGAYAAINPFGSSSLDNASNNPLTPRRRDYVDRGRPNMLVATNGQDVTMVKPSPKTKAEMTVEIECRICMEQPATVACLPCGAWDCSLAT